MKQIILFAAALIMTFVAHAKTISPSEEKTDISSIDQTIRLAETRDREGTLRKVNIVITDHGLSTDVSPRYSIYLGYSSSAEMGNLYASYKITDQAYSDVSAKKLSPGIYEVKWTEYRGEDGMVSVTQKIDANAVYATDRVQRKQCGNDFCDGRIKADLTVTETAVKQ
ncbi:hypothetical protein [Bdellovibrio sp. KM01]|uniref:hypothetical protein n=1 Tax=Bdellovibrio sp. KM01 TaxID=2748865 RepID=UPI0015EA3074|nr:hypothetical protein [Bdellovibrio sp. KM01]QLY23985.1 hypothetical protein HW988_10895 [Bdellovibrio sp. KM01]